MNLIDGKQIAAALKEDVAQRVAAAAVERGRAPHLVVIRVGEDPACKYNGGTAFIGPYGETLAAAPDGKEAAVEGEIDLGRLADYHGKFPVLEDADDFVIR